MDDLKSKRKILIVDDDKDLVDLHKMYLEKNGYEISVAYSGQECFDKVNSNPPDIILLDLMMETYSEGTNVVSHLRKKHNTKRIPIILISSVNMRNPLDEEDPEELLDVDGYMVKPIDINELLSQIKILRQDSNLLLSA